MKTRRLLYVDDSSEIAHLVQVFFEKRFPAYEVHVAGSVDEALDQLRVQRAHAKLPHAIAVDVNLHVREDGVALVEAVRDEFPKIRTVLVSGAPRHSNSEMPAHAFILKDGNLVRFVERIFELIQCRTDELPALN